MADLQVATLLGKAQLPVALLCLPTLLAASSERLGLTIHDDGSLGEPEQALLEEALPGSRFVSRRDADAATADALAPYPVTRRFRERNPLALKLIDIVVLAPEDRVTYIDADVVALRRLCGLFDLPAGADLGVMHDRQNAYSVRSWQLLVDRGLRLGARVNTGVLSARRQAVDFEAVEWLLRRHGSGSPAVWMEQTCWAFLAGRSRSVTIDPAQARLAQRDRPLAGELLLHVITPERGELPRYLDGIDRSSSVPERVRWIPTGRCGWPSLLAEELRRRLARSRRRR